MDSLEGVTNVLNPSMPSIQLALQVLRRRMEESLEHFEISPVHRRRQPTDDSRTQGEQSTRTNGR